MMLMAGLLTGWSLRLFDWRGAGYRRMDHREKDGLVLIALIVLLGF
jgi:hypothetical protein